MKIEQWFSITDRHVVITFSFQFHSLKDASIVFWDNCHGFFPEMLKSFATCVLRLRWDSQHDCGHPRSRPLPQPTYCFLENILYADPAKARTQPCTRDKGGTHRTFLPNRPLRSANNNIRPSLSKPSRSRTNERVSWFQWSSLRDLRRKLLCMGVVMCSLYQIYVESSLLAFEGATSRLLFWRTASRLGEKGMVDRREMFLLMYFPVGRKTHVVAFNLIRVTLRAVSRLHALRETFSDNFY